MELKKKKKKNLTMKIIVMIFKYVIYQLLIILKYLIIF